MATEEEKKIADAFNTGYIMNKFEPGLLDSILKSNNKDSEYINAMKLGKQQSEREKIIKQQQSVNERQKERKRGR